MKSAIAKTQYALTAGDLQLVLALVRGGTLADAASRLAADASTVFRGVQRIEKCLGQRLFERTRQGYLPSDATLEIARHAERIEAELEAARGTASAQQAGTVSGTVRISTLDTVLHGLLLPVLPALLAAHPRLHIEASARNELVNLTQREADIALRATNKPQPHLVGRELGLLRSAIFAARPPGRTRQPIDPASAPWLAVDDALPEHPSVRWRRRHLPQVVPRIKLNSVHSVFEGVSAGLGVGILPLFLAARHPGLQALSEPLVECDNQLWLLTHPESRHLRRIATVAQHLATQIRLPEA